MTELAAWADLLRESDLLAAGGWLLVAIFGLSTLLWLLILDRYRVFFRQREALLAETVARWSAQTGSGKRVNERLRRALTASYKERLSRDMPTIQVLCAVLPLLGLLGTVTGMIKTFEVMTTFGTGNIRGMAEGISQALITTMAGLMTALSGIYFAADLESRTDRAVARLGERLKPATGKPRQQEMPATETQAPPRSSS